MGVTRLKRKDLRNKSKANNRVSRIKQLTATPVIKNVDVEAIKASFKKADDKKATAKAEKAVVSEKETAPKAEKKEKTAEKSEKEEDSSEKA
jgi:hypothetical protein